MSTRAVIARETETGFSGVYHHWDGYPSGLGRTLFHLATTLFKEQRDKLLAILIDAHPQGWSTINRDWNLAPQALDRISLDGCAHCDQTRRLHWDGDNDQVLGHPYSQPPQYYDDAVAANAATALLTEHNASKSGCEWAYVFTERDTLKLLSSYQRDGSKMIGMFGCGDDDALWFLVAEINLQEQAPDWKKIEQS